MRLDSKSIENTQKPTHFAVIFDSARKNFRNEIYSDYKANRAEAPDDLAPQFEYIRKSVEAFNLPAGGEVITPALTFSTSVGCIIKNNLVPAFVDVEPNTYCIDHNKIEEMITKKTVAILAPNLLGNLCEWKSIKEIADKEIPGFVVNRLQGALLIEAFNLVKEGICSAREIDKAISEGLGLRWSFMGPFQTIHLNAPEGIAGYVDRYEKMYQGMFEKLNIEWSSVIKLGLEQELLKLYDLGEREKYENERDNKLTKLILHKTKT